MNIGKLRTNAIDLKGSVFNYLTVIELSENRNKYGSLMWKCECFCGNFKDVPTTDLKKGRVKSCGCIRKKFPADRIENMKGAKNPSWKGGKSNKGSYAWANHKLMQGKWKEDGFSKDITVEQYIKLIKEANGICEICGIHESENSRGHCVDHDHKTGELRGLLCTSCNTGIGVFHDSIEKLEKAIEYLKNKQNEHR